VQVNAQLVAIYLDGGGWTVNACTKGKGEKHVFASFQPTFLQTVIGKTALA
jgi:c-di-AMP phosphodiesterase-like protein